jgi:hypothetical protein
MPEPSSRSVPAAGGSRSRRWFWWQQVIYPAATATGLKPSRRKTRWQ